MSKRSEYTYEWPRPALTVDVFVFALPQGRQQAPHVLLIKRKHDPFAGCWALPGGFVDEGERLITAAARELEEETSVKADQALLQQVGTFGDPGRDPRGWTVSVVYAAVVDTMQLGVKVRMLAHGHCATCFSCSRRPYKHNQHTHRQ
jgi:8-oxo-dGTP diphosphatase